MDADCGSLQAGKDGVVTKDENEVNMPLRYWSKRRSSRDNLEGPPRIWTDMPAHSVNGHQIAVHPSDLTSSSQLALAEAGNVQFISCSHRKMLLNGEISLNMRYTSEIFLPSDPNTFQLHKIRSNISLSGFDPITPGKNQGEVQGPEIIDLENNEIIVRDPYENVAAVTVAGKVPEQISFDQSTSENIADAVSNKTSSSSLALVTPGKHTAMQTDQPSVDDAKQQEGNCINTALQQPSEDPVKLSSGLPSQLHIQEVQNVDFIKTPLQRPRKKKHRPKVIQEFKPTRRKKQVNPKSQLTEEGLPRKRRKYVRRKGINVEAEPSGTGEKIAQLVENHVQKTVKRSLNFDSEVAIGECFGDCSLRSKDEIKSQTQNVNSNSMIKTSQVLGEVVNPSVKLVSSSSQPIVDNDNSHEITPTTQTSRKLVLKEKLKALARKRDKHACCLVPPNVQAIPDTPEIRWNKRSKRGQITCNDDAPESISWEVKEYGLTSGSNDLNYIGDSHCNDTLLVNFTQKTFKKKRTKSVKNRVGMNASISTSRLENKDQNIQNVYCFSGVQRVSLFGKWQANEHMLTCSNSEFKSTDHPSVALVEDSNCMTTNMCFNLNEPQLPSKMPISFDLTQGSSLTEIADEDQLLTSWISLLRSSNICISAYLQEPWPSVFWKKMQLFHIVKLA